MSVEPKLHVAIIMDGNRRWAHQQGKTSLFGHREGGKALRGLVEACPELGIGVLTVYAFSSENWKRTKDEVTGLMNLFRSYLRSEIKELHEQGVRLHFLGERKRLSPDVVKHMQDAEDMTRGNTRLILQVAMSYGARDEITRATRRIVEEVLCGSLSPESICEETISERLDTAGCPDPDILIRTGGEMRLSNFLLWQMSYGECFFSSKYFPEFSKTDLEDILKAFHKRQRCWGGDRAA